VVANPGEYDPVTLLGSFVVRANRDALAAGASAFPQVVATTSSGRTITVQVAMERRAAGQAFGDFGPIYVIAVDADDPAGRTVAQATVTAATNGVYRYTMTVPGTRRIGLLAGTDPDNDDFICDTGEVCGGYPVLGQGRVLEPVGSLTGIDFAVAPLGSIGASLQATGTVQPSAPLAWPGPRRSKVVGVGNR
jgi:serine protease